MNCGALAERWRRQQPCTLPTGHANGHSWDVCPHCHEPWIRHNLESGLSCIFGDKLEDPAAVAKRICDKL